MEIITRLPKIDIIRFLQCRGYKVCVYQYMLPAEEGILIDEPAIEVYTFIATKEGEEQSLSNEYLKVFEKEAKMLLKEFMNI